MIIFVSPFLDATNLKTSFTRSGIEISLNVALAFTIPGQYDTSSVNTWNGFNIFFRRSGYPYLSLKWCLLLWISSCFLYDVSDINDFWQMWQVNENLVGIFSRLIVEDSSWYSMTSSNGVSVWWRALPVGIPVFSTRQSSFVNSLFSGM